jgi:hypothetical protein
MSDLAERPILLGLLIGLLLLGAGARIFNLGYRSLATDEANLFWLARGTTGEILHSNSIGNSAPPLYALAMSPLAEAHAPESALRALSCAAGIAALLALFVLALDYAGPVGGVFAVFAAAFAPSQVFYSQFLREYSLAFLCAALLLLAFSRFQRRPTWRNATALTVMIVLGIFMQYGLALLVLALNIIFLVDLRHGEARAQRLLWWSGAQLAGLAAAWIVYDTTLRHQLHPDGFGVAYLKMGYWDGSPGSLMRLAIGNTFQLFSFAHPSVPVMQLLIGLGIVRFASSPDDFSSWADGRRAILLLTVPMAVTLGAALLRLYPYLGARQSIVLTVMFYVAAASGFVFLRRIDWKNVGTVLVLAWMAVEGLYGSYRTLTSTEPQHVRPLIETVTHRFQPGDRIYVYHDTASAFRYYYRGDRNTWTQGLHGYGGVQPQIAQITQMLAEPGRVWLLFSHCVYAECPRLVQAAQATRPTRRVAVDTGAELYLAD